jgi:hypothetical protein
MTTQFLILLLAHLIADFPLQPDWLFRLKVRHWYGILLHAFFHCLVTAILIQNPFQFWPMLMALWLIHAFIDWSKLRLPFTFLTTGFLLDQLAHGASLVLIIFFVPEFMAALNPQLLVPLIAIALISALFMMLSVTMVDVEQFAPNLIGQPAKKGRQFKIISQLVGFPVVVAILIIRFF